jgi:hypothetical protein
MWLSLQQTFFPIFFFQRVILHVLFLFGKCFFNTSISFDDPSYHLVSFVLVSVLVLVPIFISAHYSFSRTMVPGTATAPVITHVAHSAYISPVYMAPPPVVGTGAGTSNNTTGTGTAAGSSAGSAVNSPAVSRTNTFTGSTQG